MREIVCIFIVICVLSGCAPSGPIPLLNPQVIDDLTSTEHADNIAGLHTLIGAENTEKFLYWWGVLLDKIRFNME